MFDPHKFDFHAATKLVFQRMFVPSLQDRLLNLESALSFFKFCSAAWALHDMLEKETHCESNEEPRDTADATEW